MPLTLDMAHLISATAGELGVSDQHAAVIVKAFERHIAQPLAANLAALQGRHLATRNPMIYTIRGTRTV